MLPRGQPRHAAAQRRASEYVLDAHRARDSGELTRAARASPPLGAAPATGRLPVRRRRGFAAPPPAPGARCRGRPAGRGGARSSDVHSTLDRLALLELLIGLAVLAAVAAVLPTWLVRHGLRPLERIEDTAGRDRGRRPLRGASARPTRAPRWAASAGR